MDNTPRSRLQQFRQEVYHTLSKRADGFMDFMDAMTQAAQVESPVALSLSPAFRRKYPSIYDVLARSVQDKESLRELLYRYQAGVCEPLGGYEVYAIDVTLEPRPQAECLAERILQRPSKEQAAIPVHRYSWLVGLARLGTSWVAPQDVSRIGGGQRPCAVAATQVQALDHLGSTAKVVVADSNYANKVYLQAAASLQKVSLLVRLKSNQALYGEPGAYPGRYRPRKHGAQLKLNALALPPDEEQCLPIGERTLKLRAWRSYHLKDLAHVKGLVLQALLMNADGTPVFKRPLWLYWTGQEPVSLELIYRLYQWRFAVEHAFRFMKQHLGLGKANVTTISSAECWMWLAALSYWQLLLSCGQVECQMRPWERKGPKEVTLSWTPRQVQRAMAGVLATIGTPALATKRAGKGVGRAKGFHPRRQQRFPLLKRSPRAAKAA